MAYGLSETVLSNYFKDAYDITTAQRGFIEFPRELPGILCIFLISALSFMGDIKLAIVTQMLSIIGVTVLGFFTPPFAVMLIFLFISSTGMHTYMPLADSIGISLIEDKSKLGAKMGLYKSMRNIFTLVAGVAIFAGFKTGFFSFKTQIKLVFVIAAFFFVIVLLLLIVMNKKVKNQPEVERKPKLVFKKEYKYYYILASLNGAQKQIMIVFGPWVLIEMLGKGADTLSLLIIIASFLSIFFLRLLGRWIDRFGVKKLLFADALSFIGVYFLYGLLSSGFSSGKLALYGIPFILAGALFVMDRMSMQMNMVRIIYLKTIVHKSSDITPTLSAGISIDHVISIISAYLGGLAWEAWGPQYVFFIAAALSLVNLFVAAKVKLPEEGEPSKA
jgi:MFS family permease